ncbi:MAG: cell division protein ZapA [Gammaproteobacteria bacterium]|nr:cell division protein ZapA [Gammaproteobacteria bacterium]
MNDTVTTNDSTRRPVRITILGKEYHIVCPQDEKEGLLEAARQLEDKMDEIRNSGRVFGAERIAVMAALNVTHELILSGRNINQDVVIEPEFQDRIGQINDRIASVLETLDVHD